MSKKEKIIEKIKAYDRSYFNDDQKIIAIEIIKNCPEKEVQSYFDFIQFKRNTGFVFDYAPEIAKGRLITLRENVGKRINVFNEIQNDENKLIIGDNYNALKSLKITHKGKINIIYIDPPYNTESALKDGNSSSKEKITSTSKFAYKDKFGRGGWLNMINERLILAKDLLTDEGLIFVSIDDSEQAYLKVLMDNIFGEDNFVNQIAWVSNKKGRQISNSLLAKTYEYILIYSKNSDKEFKFNKLDQEYAKKIMPSIYEKTDYEIMRDEYGEFVIKNELHNSNIKAFNINTRKNLFFPLFIIENEIFTNDTKNRNQKIVFPPKNQEGLQGVWRWSKEKIENSKQDLYIDEKNNQIKIYTKIRDMSIFPKDVILSPKISTKSGTSEFLQIFEEEKFQYPKPVELLKFLIKISGNKNSIVLDFFAGSGTTGQAVLELNKEDGGNRNFILCTNNENNIAEEISYERLFRIITGKTTDGNKKFKWLDKNEPFYGAKLRVINIDDSIKISLNDQVSENVYYDCVKGLKLLNNNYNKEGLELFYDLSALNPINEEVV
ncbi:site-specific DNA-methyltransferase [[Mycoplasma] mobile]|uniref:Type III restriction-modification system methylase n=1 Tax=Mycoplasma mobile (strain ATCC 43663 / 163K / NCTC 11711) TaxID=267748 RepID=Q6KHI3_MYCM1|nr:site-specific DNA-methyltransferase [[Mycoplasma] mobile]AAT27947.1 type III restriction-modification system methylase [Mycoplasma mobile 163K]